MVTRDKASSRKLNHLLVIIFATLMLIFAQGYVQTALAEGADGVSPENTSSQTEATLEQEDSTETDGASVRAVSTTDSGYTVLAFTSDIHNQSANVEANRLGTWINKMQGQDFYGTYGGIDVMAFGGDMASANVSGDTFWTYTQADMTVMDKKGVDPVYTTGNHEYMNGSYTHSASSSTQQQFVEDSAVHTDAETYHMYCLGTSYYATSHQWNAYGQTQIDALDTYLSGINDGKPIFIITHYPLHWTSKRSVSGAGDIIDLLNQHADAGRNIVFLWGHNHTDASNSSVESHYDEIFAPGEELKFGSGNSDKRTLKFYYAAAGCMSDSEYGAGSGAVKGKGLVVTINSKSQLSFAYYDASGNNVTEDGNGGQGTALTNQDSVAVQGISIEQESASLEKGKTTDLTVSFEPVDTTERTMTWSSSDESVAAVAPDGTVTGVGEGTATITVQTSNQNTRAIYNDSIEVEVTPRSSSDPTYLIVVNGYALSTERSNNSATGGSSSYTYTGLAGVAYTDGDAVDDSIRWTIEATDDGYFIKSLDGRYLNATYTSGTNSGQGDLKLDNTSDVWTLDSGKAFDSNGEVEGTKLQSANATASTPTNPKYIGYEESPANLFSIRSSNNADTVSIKLASDPVALEGLELPETATVMERKTITLTPTFTPENATNKKVTWTSSDPSVATVDANGKVKGVAEGTATITATSVENASLTALCTVTVTENTDPVQYFVIMIDDYALSSHASTEMMSNDSGYEYHGLQAITYNTNDSAPWSILWTLEEAEGVDNGYYIKSYNGEYLSATYVRGSGSGYTGTLTVGTTQDIWVVTADGGLDTWQGDGSYLKSSNASINPRQNTPIYLTTRASNNSVDFFTVGSSSNYKTSKLIEPESILEPVAVTGITLNPISLEVEAGKSAPLTATVLPENADDKTVEWSTSDGSVATVDANGRVKGVAAGTATITATTNDGGKTATCEVTVTPSSAPGIGYVITIADSGSGTTYALSTEPSSDQLVNSGSGSQRFYYNGLAGVAYDSSTPQTEEILWLIEPATGGYYIMSQDGRYLNATYEANDTGGSTGILKLDDTPDVWTFDGTLEDWVVSGSTLHSTNANKYLTHEEGSTSAPLNLFTIRSSGESSKMIDPDTPAEVRYVEVSALTSGRDYIVAVTKDGSSVYAIENITGTSSGNTGSATLDVVSASGDEAAYIVTSNTGVVWNYNSSRYLVNNTRYLSRGDSSGAYVPRASGSGSAVTYDGSNQRLSISYSSGWGSGTTYYLTNSSGTFGLSTSSSSAAQVRIFEKQTVFNFKYVVQFVSNGVNYQSSKYATDEIPVYSGATPTREETELYTFEFAGWSSDGGTTVYGPNDALPAVTGPVTYVAQFTRVPKPTGHTVTFVDASGDEPVEITTQTVPDGEHATAPAEDPTKEGCYAFGGWYADEELNTPFDFENTAITADTTIFAKWNDAHTLTAHEAAPATCTETGTEAYWSCSVCNKLFSDEAGTAEITAPVTVPALGHNMTEHAATAATCTEPGNSAYWSCERCNKFFSDATGTTEVNENSWVVSATGHAYGEPTYTWAADKSTVTAERVCGNDNTHKESETVDATSEVTTAATCEAAGVKTWTSDAFTNTAFAVQTTTEPVPALGHDLVHHDAQVAACTEVGWNAYDTCSRCDYTTYVEIPAAGHTYGDPMWTWADDYTTATAKFTCSKCGDEQTVDATVTSAQGTGDDLGYTVYTATAAFGEDSYTATAKKINQYTLTFMVDGAQYDSITQDYGTPVTVPDDPTKPFHTFNGWSPSVPAAMPAEDMTFNAQWTAKDTYYVVGSMNNWTVSEEYELTVNPDNAGEYSGSVTLADGDQIKVVRAVAGEKVNSDHYPSAEHPGYNGTTDNYVVDQWHAGEVTLYFRPDGNFNDQYWQIFGGYFYIAGDHAIAVEVSPTNAGTARAVRSDTPGAAATTAPKGMPITVEYEAADNFQLDRIELWNTTTSSLEQTQTTPTFNMPDYDVTIKVYFKAIVWTFDDFTWTENGTDGYTAVANFTGDNGSTKSVEATVTSETSPATCTAAGETVYTATVDATASLDNQPHSGTKTVTIEALGHTSVTDAAVAPTCTETGLTEGSHCSVCGETLVAQQTVPATGHAWSAVSYTWADDNSTVTATRTCGNDATHVDTETANVTSEVTTQPTCTEMGKTTYTATFENEAFETQSKTLEDVAALNHDWDSPTYTWAADHSSVTAERVCKRVATHKENETAQATGTETKPATCEAKGETTYTSAAFQNSAFEAQTETVADIDALGHDYELTGWTWTGDDENGYTAATATFTCKNDSSHVQTVNAVLAAETTAATCTADGSTVYTATATFEDKPYTDSKTVTIAATGHDWGEVTYAWNDANTQVTATRICGNDSAHVDTETANATSEVTTQPTCTEMGKTTYNATFTNSAFEPQTKILVDVPATGHAYGAPTYEWAADHSTATATRVCANDSTHVDSETVNATSEVTTQPTCTDKGETTYTATFTNTAFATQTETVANIDATGHAWGEVSYTWADDNSKVTATRICGNDSTHVDTETADVTSEVTTQPTCTEMGETTYTSAEFENEAFEAQSKVETDVAALGHTPVTDAAVAPTCTETGLTEGSHCSVCGETLVAQETVDALGHDFGEWAVTTDPTCETKGVETRECSRCDATETRDVDTLGHDWDTPTYEWADDHGSATAERICKRNASHTETEAATVTSEVTKPATCTDKGETTYTATFTNTAFATQTETVANIDATGHAWGAPAWTWTGDDEAGYTAATATFTCANDSAHTSTATDSEIDLDIVEATPITNGSKTYTASVTGPDGKAYEAAKVVTIPATGYSWKDAVYTWNETADGFSCTALMECNEDPEQNITETVDASYAVTEPATCEGTGTGTYTATFTNTAFESQTKDVEIAALGHDYVATVTDPTCTEGGYTTHACSRCDSTYTDSETEALGHDYVAVVTEPTCTEAGYTTNTCSRCGDHYLSEPVEPLGHDWGEWTVTDEPTCTETGSETRECSRCDATETRDVDALGHAYGEPTYEWDGLESVTATMTCANDETHVVTETATVTSEVTTQPTCTDMGKTTYTATFENEAFAAQTKVETDVAATGHAYGEPTYTWDGFDKVTAEMVCENDSEHVVTETVAVNAQITKPATCVEMGETTYTATFENEAFEAQSKVETDVDIDENAHAWGEPSYEWADDYSAVTAVRVCGNKSSHLDIETAFTTPEVTKPATCAEMGETTYTATFKNEAFETKTQTVADIEIDPDAHAWGDWTELDADQHQRECANCGETETADHEWDDGVVTTDPDGKNHKTYTCESCGATKTESLDPIKISYRAGVEGSTDWQDWVSNGETAGTVGQSLRMEGLQIELENAPYPGGIRYRSQLQSDGWEKSWAEDGDTSGYAPKVSGGKRLEAVQIELYGEMAEHYDVWYHLQVQRFGWMGWVKNGAVSGTVGYAFRVETFEMVLAPKGSEEPTIGSTVATEESNMLSFVRARSYDNATWQGAKGEGDVSGTRKQTKTQVRVGLASSSLSAAGIDRGDSYVQVRVYQDGKWSSWSTEDDAYVGNAKGGAITGIQARIAPGTTLASQYDLYYRAEVKDGTGNACWLGWAVNGETAGQSNLNLEQLSFSLVPKGHAAPPADDSELNGTVEHVKQRWVIERWPCDWLKPNYRF